jgi:hypothetical protein
MQNLFRKVTAILIIAAMFFGLLPNFMLYSEDMFNMADNWISNAANEATVTKGAPVDNPCPYWQFGIERRKPQSEWGRF